jgi:hypothetical protein
MSRAPRAAFAATALAGLLLALVPAATLAATRPITFQLYMATSCIGGRASDNATLKVVWRNAAGIIKLKDTYFANSSGYWEACAMNPNTFEPRLLKIGDRLKVTVGTTSRTFVVPTLTLNLDRVNNVFKGKAPAGTTVRLNYATGLFSPYMESKNVVANSDGRWSYRKAGFGIRGGLYAYIRWHSAKNDRITIDGVAPYLTATLGSSRVTGTTKPKTTVKAKLFNATTMAQRATAAGTADKHGRFSIRLRDSAGNAVPVKAGNRLRALSVASDADWIVPGAQVAGDASTEVVTGRCRDAGTRAGAYRLEVITPGGDSRSEALGNLDAGGYFEIDFKDPFSSDGVIWYYGSDVRSGDTLQLGCLQTTGDWVQLRQPVP